MSTKKTRPIALRALFNFISFAPGKIAFLNISSIVMGLSSSIGILMMIPLAQLAGVDFQTQSDSSPWGFLTYFAEWVNNLGFTKDLGRILLIYASLAVILGTLTYARAMYGVKFQQDYIKHMRLHVYNSLLAAKWEYLSATRSAELMHRVSGQVGSMQVVANMMISLLHKIVSIIIFTGVMIAVNWQFTLMTIICALLVGITILPVRWSVKDAGERNLQLSHKMFRLLSEHLGSLKMIKSSGYEWDFQEKLREVSDDLEEQTVRITRAGAIVTFANGIGMAIGFCVMLYFAVTWLDVPVANFFLLLIIMSRIMPQVAGLQQSVLSIRNSLPAYRDIEKTLEDAQAMREADVSSDTSKLGLKNQIEFKQVQFKYPAIDKTIVDNISFIIPAKQTLALVGPSGIGKTTVADMIIGLLKPTKGKVLIDGQVLEGELIGQWRRSIAYVTQETYLFNDTIRNNLSWVKPDASDDEIWQVIDTAALKDCIKGLPQGLDSVIGDRGVRLSGGERQRLALARALLAEPELLVLDEATSSLDNKNEKLIHQALVNMHGSLTVVIIAHRETTIRHADSVLNLGANPPAIISMDQFKNSIAIG